MILLIDNFDSFTFNLVDALESLGQEVLVIKNTTSINELSKLQFDRIVISPGPGTPNSAGNVLDVIDLFHSQTPILGICLGHQAIAQYFGGMVTRSKYPMHGKLTSVCHSGDRFFQGIPVNFNVIRYNSLQAKLSEELVVTARSSDGEVMGLKHPKYNLYGLQYHPESILTEYGTQVLENWLSV